MFLLCRVALMSNKNGYLCRTILIGFVAHCTVGRHFPDKAIDLIDGACSTAKKMMQIDNQEENVDTVKKTIIVTPNHVAEVGIFFRMTCTVLINGICLSYKF
jgi:hypothetical protein